MPKKISSNGPVTLKKRQPVTLAIEPDFEICDESQIRSFREAVVRLIAANILNMHFRDPQSGQLKSAISEPAGFVPKKAPEKRNKWSGRGGGYQPKDGDSPDESPRHISIAKVLI